MNWNVLIRWDNFSEMYTSTTRQSSSHVFQDDNTADFNSSDNDEDIDLPGKYFSFLHYSALEYCTPIQSLSRVGLSGDLIFL